MKFYCLKINTISCSVRCLAYDGSLADVAELIQVEAHPGVPGARLTHSSVRDHLNLQGEGKKEWINEWKDEWIGEFLVAWLEMVELDGWMNYLFIYVLAYENRSQTVPRYSLVKIFVRQNISPVLYMKM